VLREGYARARPNHDISITSTSQAHAKINTKIENSTPCKIVTHEDFNLKLGTRDYVADATNHATLGSNRPSGGLPPNRGNITPVWLFWLYCYFFSILPPGQTVALIVTLNGSNDVFPPKEVPFGCQDDGWRHMGKISPKNSPKRGENRQFQAKTPTFLHRNISGTISPTNSLFEIGIQTTKGTSWVVRRYPKVNTTWLTAAILKIDMSSYFSVGCSDLD